MWLAWYYALMLGLVFAGTGFAARRRVESTRSAADGGTSKHWVAVGDVATEAARVSILYALWNLGGRLSVQGVEDAVSRGRRIWDFQQALAVPSEQALQEVFLGTKWLLQVANVYYAAMHVPAIGALLLWLFLRHRHRYGQWRNRLVFITLSSLVIQLFPVAPPRLVPGLGVVDTGATVGPSVYAVVGSSLSGQATAMPSLHVGWAALVALAMWRCGTRRQGWLGATHLLATVFVVTVTGHHFWADGVVAIGILGLAVVVTRRFADNPRRSEPVITT